MTFNEIVTAVQNRLNITSSASTTRIGTTVNDRYRRVMSAIGLGMTRRSTVSETVTLGVSTVVFSGCEKIINVVDRSVTPYRILKEVTVEELRRIQPFVNSFPTHYAIVAYNANSVTIEMDCIPQAAFDLYADVQSTITTLSGSNTPNFPEDFHDILVHGGLADEYRKMEKLQLAQDSEQLYTSRLSDLRMWLAKSSYLDHYQGKTRGRMLSGSAVSGAGGGGGGVNGASSYTQTGLITFDRSSAAPNDEPFAVAVGANRVLNLDADMLDGQHGSFYQSASNLNAGTIPDARFPATLPAASGANLTNLNASSLASGTVPDARFPATLPAVSGVNLTNLDASDLASGTIPDARFPATLPAVSGANLTNLDASDLASGTVPVARLGAGTFSVTTSTTTGAINNWAPTLAGNTLIEWSGASGAAFTGLAGGVTGQIVIIKNTGTQIATFAHASASSNATNRFTNLATSAPTPIAAGGWITYQHDGTNWKLIAHEQGDWITPTFAAGDWTASAGNWTLVAGDVTWDRYKLVGKELHFMIRVLTSTVSATPTELRRAIYGGFTIRGSGARIEGFIVFNDNGGAETIGTLNNANSTLTNLEFRKLGSAAWSTATDTTSLQCRASIEVV